MIKCITELGKYYSILEFQNAIPGAGVYAYGVSDERCDMKKDTSGKISIEFTKEELALIEELITNETFCGTHDHNEWLTILAQGILVKIMPHCKGFEGTFLRNYEGTK